MNPMERQMKLGTDLIELNADTLRKLAEIDTDAMSKVFNVNQEFVQGLSEIKDFSAWMDYLRQYSQSMMDSTQEVMKDRTEIVTQATESFGEIIRKAFETEPEAPEPASKSKAKTPPIAA